MTTYKVEIDDGTGEMHSIEVDAENEVDAKEASVNKLIMMKPAVDPSLVVVIMVEQSSS